MFTVVCFHFKVTFQVKNLNKSSQRETYKTTAGEEVLSRYKTGALVVLSVYKLGSEKQDSQLTLSSQQEVKFIAKLKKKKKNIVCTVKDRTQTH